MLDVCLLGCGGMMPLPKRFLTALLVRYEGKNILVDCGYAFSWGSCEWASRLTVNHCQSPQGGTSPYLGG